MGNGFIVVIVLIVVGLLIWALFIWAAKPAVPLTPEQKLAKRAEAAERLIAVRARQAELQRGMLRPQIICPQCQERGQVRCKAVTNKEGVSGGKATAALLTGGVSMLATGLSRMEAATQATCDNCQSVWQF
jgi:hypothetical protein